MYLCIPFTVTFGGFQCTFSNITLSCPNDQTISMESAIYGLYGYTSTQNDLTCKPPHYNADCTEEMSQNSPGDWYLVQELCNGRNTCTFPARAGPVTSCGNVAGSEYTSVVYQCMQGMLCYCFLLAVYMYWPVNTSCIHA